jgi:hypothetical protein
MAALGRLLRLLFGTTRFGCEPVPGIGLMPGAEQSRDIPVFSRERNAQAEAGPLMPIIMSRNMRGF